jgi:hypothetical protein
MIERKISDRERVKQFVLFLVSLLLIIMLVARKEQVSDIMFTVYISTFLSYFPWKWRLSFQLRTADNDDLPEKLITYISHLLNFLSFRTKSLSEMKNKKRRMKKQ